MPCPLSHRRVFRPSSCMSHEWPRRRGLTKGTPVEPLRGSSLLSVGAGWTASLVQDQPAVGSVPQRAGRANAPGPHRARANVITGTVLERTDGAPLFRRPWSGRLDSNQRPGNALGRSRKPSAARRWSGRLDSNQRPGNALGRSRKPSAARRWSGRLDSNQRPGNAVGRSRKAQRCAEVVGATGFEPATWQRGREVSKAQRCAEVVGATGFEPATWQRGREVSKAQRCGGDGRGDWDSNQRPLRPERSALPSCATPRRSPWAKGGAYRFAPRPQAQVSAGGGAQVGDRLPVLGQARKGFAFLPLGRTRQCPPRTRCSQRGQPGRSCPW